MTFVGQLLQLGVLSAHYYISACGLVLHRPAKKQERNFQPPIPVVVWSCPDMVAYNRFHRKLEHIKMILTPALQEWATEPAAQGRDSQLTHMCTRQHYCDITARKQRRPY